MYIMYVCVCEYITIMQQEQFIIERIFWSNTF